MQMFESEMGNTCSDGTMPKPIFDFDVVLVDDVFVTKYSSMANAESEEEEEPKFYGLVVYDGSGIPMVKLFASSKGASVPSVDDMDWDSYEFDDCDEYDIEDIEVVDVLGNIENLGIDLSRISWAEESPFKPTSEDLDNLEREIL